ncbi:MAG: ABC transporter permease subunit, partial [Verrucomicrobiota bacterium]
GTALLVVGSMAIALFLGIVSAVFLSEYSKDSAFIRTIRLAIVNLAGVPSIVFGLFGMAMFVNFGPVFAREGILEMETLFGLGLIPVFPYESESAFLSIPLLINDYYLSLQGWGVSLLAGWFTLSFMVLPIIITASEESLRAVPQGYREGSLALGATKWQTIRTNVVPYALPGILTSSILGITRVAGETAPIMFTAAFVLRQQLPWQVDTIAEFAFQGVMALPYHIYVISSKVPQNIFTEKSQYATCFVFLVLVFIFTLVSILLRIKLRDKIKW